MIGYVISRLDDKGIWRRQADYGTVFGVRRWLIFVLAIMALGLPATATPPSIRSLPGWKLYDRYCLACHGAYGDGRGPAAPYTTKPPRDFVQGGFVWRSTPLGAPPTDEDLRTTIVHGAPGTSMPGFALPSSDIDQLVAVVKAFAPASAKVKTITLAAPPPPNPKRGAELWASRGCVVCHGATGDGETPAATMTSTRPYDLSRDPLHRPRADGDVRRAAAQSIATGLGTMPTYAGSLPDADIWALADHVVTLNARSAPRPTLARADHVGGAPLRELTKLAIENDRTAKIAVATWPGNDLDETVVFGAQLAPQGPPPPALPPAEASLSARQCARCHAKQYREWETSVHRTASSPGLAAQMMGLPAAEARGCLRCHAPLAEQATDDALRAQSLSCAGCHVRNWERHGPPNVAPSLLPIPGYPLTTLALYERSDLCMTCHQLPPRTAVNGKPLLDTYREWLEGPYMKRGVQCQHCHMPNREHTWLGVHDAHTFRQGIALTARAHAKDGSITVVAELANVGAGHYLPTNPTPAAWLWIELVDARGKPIDGANASVRIGRDIYFDGVWHERSDTRIAPGERITMARAWSGGRTAEATGARITVEVHPDDYYERVYQARLREQLPANRRALYEQAQARAIAAHYVAEQRVIPIDAGSR